MLSPYACYIYTAKIFDKEGPGYWNAFCVSGDERNKCGLHAAAWCRDWDVPEASWAENLQALSRARAL